MSPVRAHNALPVAFVILLCFAGACRQADGQDQQLYTQDDVQFDNAIDGVRLTGTLTVPVTSRPVPAVVLIAGSGPHERDFVFGKHRLFFTVADYLSRRGVAVLRYDKRGVGQSTGVYEPHDIDGYTQDALAAIDFLKHREGIDTALIGALGISQGGLVAPRMAARSAGVRFLVMIGAPGVWGEAFASASSVAIARAAGYDEMDVARLRALYDTLWPLYTKPELAASDTRDAKRLLAQIAGFMDSESRSLLMLDDVDAYFAFMRSPDLLQSMDDDPADVLRLVRCPVLALYGSKDVQIPPAVHRGAVARALEEGGNHAYRIEELQGMNHVLQRAHTGLPNEYLASDEAMAPEALETIARWILAVTTSEYTRRANTQVGR